ncbi:APC family permease [Caulobacter sp. 17J80-11]|uniref:APC family permease n=1 Tax=Caulobacter sp. 17J80-11 TaxID=2763502 RepID=UPI00165347B2|nr:APC family permease [Caulobacter sp. 17J80-11]MBC6982350.1 APC family permease [Caulobacter sp. 17J80-11]
MNLWRLILGRRLANRDSPERKIGAFEGVPAMGLDGLGSSAYGPEAALTILMPLGAASLAFIGWVMAPIVCLLAVLFASYWQTIAAYPSNGGAYIVARENLGTGASLLAAAALMIDYVLNVAVGISAGVGALVSAVPALHPHILPLCLGILAVVTVVNLRGTLDAGRLFAIPTYLFVASFLLILLIGVVRTLAAAGAPHPLVSPAPLGPATQAASAWLLLHAFASGCTAMTGVEAVSNGMGAFREPRVRYGHRTLAAIVAILGVLLAGIAWLASAYHVGAMDQSRAGYRSVLSQLAAAVVGQGVFYYVAIGALLSVLALSANTSFAGFPRLCRTVAADGFLPKSFTLSGRRLVFSVGMLYLCACAGVLLVAFGGITDRLIPLFAIGAFLTFTLSQAGMVLHWRRMLRQAKSAAERRGHSAHLAINAVGALTTGAALAVILTAKFFEGAWITALAIPLVIALLHTIGRYYRRLEKEVAATRPVVFRPGRPMLVLVALERWNRVAEKAVQFALTLSPDVIGVHLSQLSGPDEDEDLTGLKRDWRIYVEDPARTAGRPPPRLFVLAAQRRSLHEPFLKLTEELEESFGPRRSIAVLIPQIVGRRWWEYPLHAHRARALRAHILKHGGEDVTLIDVPWRLE